MDKDGIGNYLNCYSTYLMTKKDLADNILYHRMNVLINYYIANTITPPRKIDLINYYLSNWSDDYLSKPFITYVKPNKDEYWDDMDKDVRDHYSFLTSRPPSEPDIDYDEYDKKFYQEEEDKRMEELNKINDDDDYYYDDWDDFDDWVDYDYDNCNEDEYYEYR